ncbi:MAG: protein kinase [Myxococcota bacterium]
MAATIEGLHHTSLAALAAPVRSTNAMTSRQEMEQGTSIDARYTIDHIIGRGGFATVYRAHDTRRDQWVAIKILNTADVRPEARGKYLERFRREASIAVALNHPYIIKVHDYGALPAPRDQPYMVMELLEGHDLDDELKMYGPLEPDRALRLILWTLDALGTAHHRGIVHKDLKPSNMFIVHPGHPDESLKLLDFGVARLHSDLGSPLTTQGRFIGTPKYLAPEYIRHQEVSPRLDVYQMGLIVVELLTGEAVVNQRDPTTCLGVHLTGHLQFPAPLLESELGAILSKATALDPADRYPDAFALRDVLMAVDISTLDTSTLRVATTPSLSQGFDATDTLRSGDLDATARTPSVAPPASLTDATTLNITHALPHEAQGTPPVPSKPQSVAPQEDAVTVPSSTPRPSSHRSGDGASRLTGLAIGVAIGLILLTLGAFAAVVFYLRL